MFIFFLQKFMKLLDFDNQIILGDDYYFYRNSFLNHKLKLKGLKVI